MAIKWVGTRENGHYEDDANPGVAIPTLPWMKPPADAPSGNPLAGLAAGVGRDPNQLGPGAPSNAGPDALAAAGQRDATGRIITGADLRNPNTFGAKVMAPTPNVSLTPDGNLVGPGVDAQRAMAGAGAAVGTAVDPKAATDTTAFGQDRTDARMAYQNYLDQQNRPGVLAPGINASTTPTTGDVNFRAPGPIERVSANMPGPVTLGGQAQGVTAQRVAAPTAVPTSTTGASIIGTTQVQDAQAQQVRQQQLDFAQALRDRMNGVGPSVAQQQYNMSVGDIATGALGTAAQARGNDAAAARRDALRTIGTETAKAGLGSALIRAQESATAAGQLGGALTDTRGLDTSVAVKNADLTQGANLANQGSENTVGMFNSGQTNANNQFNADLATRVATGNADRSLSGDTFSAGQQNARDVAVAGVNAANADRTVGAVTTDAAAANARATDTAKTQAEIDAQNMNRLNQENQFNATQTQGAAQVNAGNTLTADQIEQARQASLRAATDAAAGRSAAAAGSTVNTDLADKARVAGQQNNNYAVDKSQQNALAAGGLNVVGTGLAATASYLGGKPGTSTGGDTGGTGGAPSQSDFDNNNGGDYTSDKRQKMILGRDSNSDVDSFLKALDERAYTYKNPAADGGGVRHGPMAQELEKSNIGRSVVKLDPDGVKRVDTPAFVMALAGAVARKLREGGKRAA